MIQIPNFIEKKLIGDIVQISQNKGTTEVIMNDCVFGDDRKAVAVEIVC